MLSNQGKKAVFSLFSKIQDDCFNTETLLLLFDTYVKSVVNYGCEVWGFHKGVDIETLHLSFLKRVRVLQIIWSILKLRDSHCI
jgi:hypothetical protein